MPGGFEPEEKTMVKEVKFVLEYIAQLQFVSGVAVYPNLSV